MSNHRNAYDLVREYGDRIENGRTLRNILAHGLGEMEELREEIDAVHTGRPAGKDGIAGEAIDVIACVYDLVHQNNPSLAGDRIERLATEWRAAESRTESLDTMELFRRAEGRMDHLGASLSGHESGESGYDTSILVTSLAVAAAMFDIIARAAPDLTHTAMLDMLEQKLKNWGRDYAHSIHRVRP